MDVPELKINKSLYTDDGRQVPETVVQMQDVVWRLLSAMRSAGWRPIRVEDDSVSSATEAMEEIFNLDMCWVKFSNGGKNHHSIMLVPANHEPYCIVSDWTYRSGDDDGFDAAVNSFMNALEKEEAHAQNAVDDSRGS